MSYAMASTYTNESEGYTFGDEVIRLEDTYDPDVLDADGKPNMGAIFRMARKEFGACQSSVYVDTEQGTKRVGWFFVKRDRYEDDTRKTYLRGVWVTVGEYVPARSAGVVYQ